LTRAEAIDRLRRALDEYAVGGIRTTLPFFREIVRDEEFVAGRLDTGFIPRFNQRRRGRAAGPKTSRLETDIAIIAAAVAYAQAQPKSTNHQPRQAGKWKTAGRALTLNRTPQKPAPQFDE
jgi:acetyl-CoA carboxylase biotin carboxylase subunit